MLAPKPQFSASRASGRTVIPFPHLATPLPSDSVLQAAHTATPTAPAWLGQAFLFLLPALLIGVSSLLLTILGVALIELMGFSIERAGLLIALSVGSHVFIGALAFSFGLLGWRHAHAQIVRSFPLPD